jgi:hypothetical protein
MRLVLPTRTAFTLQAEELMTIAYNTLANLLKLDVVLPY